MQRFAADGTPDAAFGGDGTVELAYQERIQVDGVAIQTDGMIVAGGYRFDQQSLDREWMLYRLTSGGALDGTFDANGRRLVDFGQPAGQGEAISTLHLAGGRTVEVGHIEIGGVNRYGIARLTSDLIFRDDSVRASAEFARSPTGRAGWGR